MKTNLRAKELSWLSFNARVLQEAADPKVPILERIKFLGIYSSNLDEFFRVRVATLRRIAQLRKKAKRILGYDPKKVLKEIQETSLALHRDFDATYNQVLKELAKERVFIVNNEQLTGEQGEFVRDYFQTHLRSKLMPIMLHPRDKFPTLRDESIYLAILFPERARVVKAKYALIEVPQSGPERFLQLPSPNGDYFIILVDDVIRFCLGDIFSLLNVDRLEAFTIKVSRDAELAIESDLSESYIRKVTKSLKQRTQGAPVRFVYDADISPPLLKFLTSKLRLTRQDTLIPGAKYHNFKDFMKFPRVGSSSLRDEPRSALANRHLSSQGSFLTTVAKRDVLLHFPYQSFESVVALLREAAIDPYVTSIKTTLYRIARDSAVVNALINAVQNRKDVTAVIELRARFDEMTNIELANRLEDEGVRVIHGVPELKVHSKLCLIERRVRRQTLYCAVVGTGNFNEDTTKIYSDHALLTADSRLTREVRTIFDFFESKYPVDAYKHLIVSPFNVRPRLAKLVRNETKNASRGRQAFIDLKLNNLTDPELIGLLYDACDAGVKLRLNVRGMFSMLPDEVERADGIKAMGIVDKYLEHSRIMVFCNGGAPKYFISSADWMPRNLDGRVEVGVPIYDTSLQNELQSFLDLQWEDNTKVRILDQTLDNRYQRTPGNKSVRMQEDFYSVLRRLHERRARPQNRQPTKPKTTARTGRVPLRFEPTKKRDKPDPG